MKDIENEKNKVVEVKEDILQIDQTILKELERLKLYSVINQTKKKFWDTRNFSYLDECNLTYESEYFSIENFVFSNKKIPKFVEYFELVLLSNSHVIGYDTCHFAFLIENEDNTSTVVIAEDENRFIETSLIEFLSKLKIKI